LRALLQGLHPSDSSLFAAAEALRDRLKNRKFEEYAKLKHPQTGLSTAISISAHYGAGNY
jgi:hypothetical protein